MGRVAEEAGRSLLRNTHSAHVESLQLSSAPTWYAKKPYLHFDLPLGPEAASAYVSSPQKVECHAFYPLLKYELSTPRIEKLPPGSARSFVRKPKLRPIAYPAHKDGYIFSYYKTILECRYKDWLKSNGLGDVVTAFRSTGENNVTLANKAFDFIRANPSCKIVVTDIESFFNNLNHDLIKRTWARFLGDSKLPSNHYAVYKAITHYSFVERHKAYNLFKIRLSGRLNRANSPRRLCTPKEFREKIVARGLIQRGPSDGIPQGTSLSPLLSNMYMADLDLAMHDWITSLSGRYWRYCDDILVVIPDEDGPDVLQKLDSQLELLCLKRSKPKTSEFIGSDLTSREQLQYLGFLFNGSEVVVRSSSIHRYRRKLRKGIRMAKGRQAQESQGKSLPAPFRKQALYNMYSDKPVRGKRIQARNRRRRFIGNFVTYMDRAAKQMNSPSITRQREKVLKRFRDSVRQP